MSEPVQAFYLADEIFDAISVEDVDATFATMESLGIAKAPYETFDIVSSAKNHFGRCFAENAFGFRELSKAFAERGDLLQAAKCEQEAANSFFSKSGPRYDRLYVSRFEGLREVSGGGIFNGKVSFSWFGDRDWSGLVDANLKLLIVLLATKNIVKERSESKLAKLGIGKGKYRPRYSTTLRIGEITENLSGRPLAKSGRVLLPHWRRGHERKQHFGPGNQFVKRIFIEPCFVNRDVEYVGSEAVRDHYNVGFAA